MRQSMYLTSLLLWTVTNGEQPRPRDLQAQINYISTFQPSGIQSGPDDSGSTFVSSVVYSPASNSIVLTGNTWGRYFESRQQIMDEDYDTDGEKIENPTIISGCFLATAALPGMNPSTGELQAKNGKPVDHLFWSHRERIRAPSNNEACNAVLLFGQTESVIIAGHSEEYHNQVVNGDIVAAEVQQLGMLLDFDWNEHGDKSFNTVGGQMLRDRIHVYPVAMTSGSPREQDGLYVVFMEANNNDPKHMDQSEGKLQHMPTEYFNYGAGYGYSIVRFDFQSIQMGVGTGVTKQIAKTWVSEHQTTETKGQVYVADIDHVAEGVLLVVGSTNGQGPSFGGDKEKGKDMDGFITKINMSTGGTLDVEVDAPNSVRIQSSKHLDDYVSAICRNPNDHAHFYVVGTTEGALPGAKKVQGTSAFVTKYETRSMKPVWTKQLGAKGNRNPVVRGFACAVTPDDESVWFGGVVENGAYIPQAGLKKSFGGMDIFVAQVKASNGDLIMAKQLGSSKDDEMAKRGGLVTDMSGNAIVVGNTFGSFYRTRSATEKESDAFVFTVAVYGGETQPLAVEMTPAAISGLTLMSLTICAILLATYLYARHSRKGKILEVTTDRSKVLSYIGDFSVEDLHLKHSACGGWHCTFENDLAEGKYAPLPTVSRTRPRSNLSRNRSGKLPDLMLRPKENDIANTEFSLCDAGREDDLDVSARSSQGLLGGEAGSIYGDLVGIYKETWESRLPMRTRSGKGARSLSREIV